MKKYQSFLSENFQFLEVKFSIYLNRRVFVMRDRFGSGQFRSCVVSTLCRFGPKSFRPILVGRFGLIFS